MKVLLCGCLYGAGNIGDEAILAGLLELLPKDLKIGVSVAGSAELYAARQLKTFGYSKPAALRAIAWADLVVLGGASLLTDPMGPGYPIFNCAFILDAARALGRPAIFLGIGATKLNHAESLRVARKSYPQAELFFVRNEASKEALAGQLDIPSSKVFTIADPAFMLAGRTRLEQGRQLLKQNGIEFPPGRRMIGVSVVSEGFEKGRDYHQSLAAACDALWRQHGCELVFLHSEIREGPRYDQAAAAAVRALMTSPSQQLPAHFYDPIEFASMLGNFDCVIAMRMHVVILCALSGVPCALIVREAKVSQIAHDLEIKRCSHIDTVTAEEVTGDVLACLADRENLRRHLLQRVEVLALRCREVFAQHMVWTGFPRLPWRERLRSQARLLNELLLSVRRRIVRGGAPDA